MCAGKSKALIKFNVWLFFVNLENQEKSCFFALHLLNFYIIFYILASHFHILHKATTLIFKIDKRKKINHPLGETYVDQSYIGSKSPFDKTLGLLQVFDFECY